MVNQSCKGFFPTMIIESYLIIDKHEKAASEKNEVLGKITF